MSSKLVEVDKPDGRVPFWLKIHHFAWVSSLSEVACKRGSSAQVRKRPEVRAAKLTGTAHSFG